MHQLFDWWIKNLPAVKEENTAVKLSLLADVCQRVYFEGRNTWLWTSFPGRLFWQHQEIRQFYFLTHRLVGIEFVEFKDFTFLVSLNIQSSNSWKICIGTFCSNFCCFKRSIDESTSYFLLGFHSTDWWRSSFFIFPVDGLKYHR